jgi:hypothetical protein
LQVSAIFNTLGEKVKPAAIAEMGIDDASRLAHCGKLSDVSYDSLLPNPQDKGLASDQVRQKMGVMAQVSGKPDSHLGYQQCE